MSPTSVSLVGGEKKTTSEFRQQLINDNYAQTTIRACCNLLARLESKGIDPLQPEEFKKWLSEQKLKDHSKYTTAVYYGVFLEYMHIQWKPPKITYALKKAKAPLREDVKAFINGISLSKSIFIQMLSETGYRLGEGLRVQWTDVDFERNTVVLNNPEKNSDARISPITSNLAARLNMLKRKGDRVFPCTKNSMYASFRQQRRKLAFELKNERLLKITFHDFRRYFATQHYMKYLSLVKTAQALGVDPKNALRYIDTESSECPEYEVQVATTVEEGKRLGEAGYDHYDTIDDRHLYRRRKLT